MNDALYDLAALDMDGTLLNSNHEITPFTREALGRASAAGKVVALCTGRCMSELWAHLAAVPGIAYVIGENGACLYDVRAGRTLSQLAIEPGEGKRLLGIAMDYEVIVQCFIGGQSWLQLEDRALFERCHMTEFAPVFDTGSRYTGDVLAQWLDSGLPLEKINFYFAAQAGKDEFRRRAGKVDLYVAHSIGIGYEFSPRDATKANGLEALCRHLGLPVSRAMAVGDGGNDVELMRSAGLSVAMGNAVEEVLQAADAVTEDCDHDGAAKAVLRYLLGEEPCQRARE